MKIDCVIKFWARKKPLKEFFEIPSNRVKSYIESGYETHRELCIISVDKKGDQIELLKKQKIDYPNNDVEAVYVHFHNISYVYIIKEDMIYCTNTIQKI